jgi:bifunctional UDP-N-acetylglucosamine pyrophosphorylase/glucosamine-1-phosphate N-acetyltransferase
MTVGTCQFSDPFGMGRIIRDGEGKLEAIIEEKDASPEQRKITEVNPGLYVFDSSVFAKTKRLTNNNKSGEYYVTDVPLLYLQDGQSVRTYLIQDEEEVLGVNDRKHLAHIDGILQNRIREKWLLSGVTMTSPDSTFIDDTVEIARDVVLEPGVILKGKTKVAESARIGAYSHLTDCNVAKGVVIAPHMVATDRTFA